MSATNPFSTVDISVLPRSFHHLSQSNRTTLGYGYLYPVFALDLMPGATIKVGATSILKAQPMVAPSMTPQNLYLHSFFVPYRLVDRNFTKGVIGCDEKGTRYDYQFPIWNPPSADQIVGSLWDYFGLPINVQYGGESAFQVLNTNCKGVEPTVYLKRAYNLIYNEWFRDENLVDEVDLDSELLQKRAWKKDYFTACLSSQQKPNDVGSYASLPVNTILSESQNAFNLFNSKNVSGGSVSCSGLSFYNTPETIYRNASDSGMFLDVTGSQSSTVQSYPFSSFSSVSESGRLVASLNPNWLSATSTAFDVSDMRLAFQLQKYYEKNARGGTRYVEWLKMHFHSDIHDDTLQIPEFVGGTKVPILVNDIFQTSQTSQNAPLGTRGGVGNSILGDYIGKWSAREHGVFIVLASVLPRAEYMQGVNRMWIKHDNLDWYKPEFCMLSEREVYRGELVCSSSSDDSVAEQYNKSLFGYQEMYNEYRYLPDITTGHMRTVFNYWHQTRNFDPSVENNFNREFIECDPSMRTFASYTEDPFMCMFNFDVKAYLPMTYRGTPGFIDHF
ncbi:major capsid protein [Capybara microvirus Cap1_SP_161]|nr:major capsid protein [Capybara microvirus Cap1_SP_161]